LGFAQVAGALPHRRELEVGGTVRRIELDRVHETACRELVVAVSRVLATLTNELGGGIACPGRSLGSRVPARDDEDRAHEESARNAMPAPDHRTKFSTVVAARMVVR